MKGYPCKKNSYVWKGREPDPENCYDDIEDFNQIAFFEKCNASPNLKMVNFSPHAGNNVGFSNKKIWKCVKKHYKTLTECSENCIGACDYSEDNHYTCEPAKN